MIVAHTVDEVFDFGAVAVGGIGGDGFGYRGCGTEERGVGFARVIVEGAVVANDGELLRLLRGKLLLTQLLGNLLLLYGLLLLLILVVVVVVIVIIVIIVLR